MKKFNDLNIIKEETNNLNSTPLKPLKQVKILTMKDDSAKSQDQIPTRRLRVKSEVLRENDYTPSYM